MEELTGRDTASILTNTTSNILTDTNVARIVSNLGHLDGPSYYIFHAYDKSISGHLEKKGYSWIAIFLAMFAQDG